MKNNLIKTILLLVFSVFMISCHDRDTDPRVGADAVTKPAFTNAPSGKYVVTAVNLLNPFHTFIIKNATYDAQIQLNNQIEISADGTTFTPFANLGDMFTGNVAEITYQQLNNAVAALGLAPNVEHVVYIRIKSSPVNDLLNPTYSETSSFIVVPYEPDYDAMFPKIYMPGVWDPAALGAYAQWDPANSPALYSAKSDGKYTGFQFMAFDQTATYPLDPDNGAFKFTPGPSWDNDFGDDTSRTGKLTKDGEWNIQLPNYPAQNTFFFVVNTTDNTYSLTKANMGMIGDATPGGWGSQTDLVYNSATQKFEIPSIALVPGVFKFRNDGNWGIKLQPKDSEVTIESGKKIQIYNSANNEVSGDPNFKIATAGNYKIVVDLHNSGFYNMTITKL